MKKVGLIGGTLFYEEASLRNIGKEHVSNRFGTADVRVSDRFIYVARHGTQPDHYIHPHVIDHPATMQALKDLGVTEVIGVHSTGSLKKELKPGMIVIPDDFISLAHTATAVSNREKHITPALDEPLRRQLYAAAEAASIPVIDGGVYWQTTGPRLETRAEIRFISRFADLVGMTMASEAVVARELDIPYASICSIDNYGNGLIEKPLNADEIRDGAQRNAKNVLAVINVYLDRRERNIS